MPMIDINGTEHEVTEDGFGIKYIDGMPLDQFTQTLSEDDMIWCAEHGMKIYSDDPEHAQDIIERYEI